MRAPRYRSVILDVDSTLCGVEGIDWLAERRGADVSARVRSLTDRAMEGEIALDTVYGERLALSAPSRSDVSALALRYQETLAPGARRAIEDMRDCGVRLVLVSGGLRDAILPVARILGFADTDVHAVGMTFGTRDEYLGFDTTSPLATAHGKIDVARTCALAAPSLAVGDGMTDAAMRPAVTAFAAFTGFVNRPNVVAQADLVIDTFSQLSAIVLG